MREILPKTGRLGAITTTTDRRKPEQPPFQPIVVHILQIVRHVEQHKHRIPCDWIAHAWTKFTAAQMVADEETIGCVVVRNHRCKFGNLDFRNFQFHDIHSPTTLMPTAAKRCNTAQNAPNSFSAFNRDMGTMLTTSLYLPEIGHIQGAMWRSHKSANLSRTWWGRQAQRRPRPLHWSAQQRSRPHIPFAGRRRFHPMTGKHISHSHSARLLASEQQKRRVG